MLPSIDSSITALATTPRLHGYKKLKGVKNLYRIRVGDYRILYQIEDKRLVIVVVRIGNRREIYKLGR